MQFLQKPSFQLGGSLEPPNTQFVIVHYIDHNLHAIRKEFFELNLILKTVEIF